MKKFKIAKEDIKQILEDYGACLASDKITVDGLEVGYMYREAPGFEADSGWRIFSNTESQEYIENIDYTGIYMLNTIANYDPTLIPYLQSTVGTELERIEGTKKFEKVKYELN